MEKKFNSISLTEVEWNKIEITRGGVMGRLPKRDGMYLVSVRDYTGRVYLDTKFFYGDNFINKVIEKTNGKKLARVHAYLLAHLGVYAWAEFPKPCNGKVKTNSNSLTWYGIYDDDDKKGTLGAPSGANGEYLVTVISANCEVKTDLSYGEWHNGYLVFDDYPVFNKDLKKNGREWIVIAMAIAPYSCALDKPLEINK